MNSNDESNAKTQNQLGELFGAILADLRKSSDLTQKDLAKKFNVSTGSISHYEQGFNLVSVELLCAIADYFGVSTDYLLGRCTGKFDYKKLNSNLDSNMTLGEFIDIVDKLPKSKKQYLYRTILLLRDSPNNVTK